MHRILVSTCKYALGRRTSDSKLISDNVNYPGGNIVTLNTNINTNIQQPDHKDTKETHLNRNLLSLWITPHREVCWNPSRSETSWP